MGLEQIIPTIHKHSVVALDGSKPHLQLPNHIHKKLLHQQSQSQLSDCKYRIYE